MAVHKVFSSLELLPDHQLWKGSLILCCPGSYADADNDIVRNMQEEALSAGGSRKAAGGAPLWNLAVVPHLGMVSLTAGWGDLERSPAQGPGPPGWRNGALKVGLHAWLHRNASTETQSHSCQFPAAATMRGIKENAVLSCDQICISVSGQLRCTRGAREDATCTAAATVFSAFRSICVACRRAP